MSLVDVSQEYVEMCLKLPKEFWDDFEVKTGTYLTWRNFVGIVVPNSNPKFLMGIAKFVPELLAWRTWCQPNQNITVTEIEVVSSDVGTPLPSQKQLQEMIIKGCKNSKKNFPCLQDCDGKCLSELFFEYFESASSMHTSLDQIWLAYVLESQYGQVFVNGKWILEEGK